MTQNTYLCNNCLLKWDIPEEQEMPRKCYCPRCGAKDTEIICFNAVAETSKEYEENTPEKKE